MPTEPADSNTTAPWFGGVVNFALWARGGPAPSPIGSPGSLRGGRVAPPTSSEEGPPWQWRGSTDDLHAWFERVSPEESPAFEDTPEEDE